MKKKLTVLVLTSFFMINADSRKYINIDGQDLKNVIWSNCTSNPSSLRQIGMIKEEQKAQLEKKRNENQEEKEKLKKEKEFLFRQRISIFNRLMMKRVSFFDAWDASYHSGFDEEEEEENQKYLKTKEILKDCQIKLKKREEYLESNYKKEIDIIGLMVLEELKKDSEIDLSDNNLSRVYSKGSVGSYDMYRFLYRVICYICHNLEGELTHEKQQELKKLENFKNLVRINKECLNKEYNSKDYDPFFRDILRMRELMIAKERINEHQYLKRSYLKKH